MKALHLSFGSGEDSLEPRSFSVNEELSKPFRVDIVARSQSPDIDMDSIVGQAAVFRMVGLFGLAPARTWTGICARCEQTRVEPSGLSTYELTIVPALWLLGRRRNHRLFQHMSHVDIATALLSEWKVAHEFALDTATYPKLELRTQYGESDLAFFSRMMEEAGITYFFKDDPEKGSTLVFTDRPHAADPRPAPPLPFLDEPPSSMQQDTHFATGVRVFREVRPAKVVLRDFDFRAPDFPLFANASSPGGIEQRLEQYRYAPGAFLVEGNKGGDTPSADDKGIARHTQGAGTNLAARMLEGERSGRRGVRLVTNAYDIGPGVVFSILGHPRDELAPTKFLLTKGIHFQGEVGKEWTSEVTALFTDIPVRPQAVHERPHILGVQSAVVVGPKGDRVHTDEHGRVRVQFHWDREGNLDDGSSCWIRVSHPWAGGGYGMMNLPRVGHEVLVSFYDGNPDQPVIVGRVWNGKQQVPYKLPASKLVSAWKSDSNSNIILFDDTPGEEKFYTQAEKDRVGIVKKDEKYLTGGKRTTAIRKKDSTLVGQKAEIFAGQEISLVAGQTISQKAGMEFSVTAGMDAKVKAGMEVETSVHPVAPLVSVLMKVISKKAKLDKALPGGAPDLQSVLPAHMKGKLAEVKPEEAGAKVVGSAEEAKKKLQKPLLALAKALLGLTPEELEELKKIDDVEKLVEALLDKAKDPNDPTKLGDLLAALQGLLDALVADPPKDKAKDKVDKSKKKEDEEESAALEILDAVITEILTRIIPKTKIKIEFQKIKITTDKATVELDKDKIKLKADGDIEVKAGGSVKIEGKSVSIKPSPCKCK
ncbi:MAG: type VI secretion system tip protein VgrG [Polyangiaceae bacterium]|nr:type VI secretion system tip protein VgrG [Polyangiaceae bacterium]